MDWMDDGPTVELVTAIAEKQHAGGRLVVVVGPQSVDVQRRFAALLEDGMCELLG